MSIQSLSIVVPSNHCINNCEFCVSRTHRDLTYQKYIKKNDSNIIGDKFKIDFDKKYIKALTYAKDLGCTTVMLTGECEPQQNMAFLRKFLKLYLKGNSSVREALFSNIELQTTGRGLTRESIFELASLGVNTFSISLSSFYEKENAQIINQGRDIIPIKKICAWIKETGSLLRLSLNLNDIGFYRFTPQGIFSFSKTLYGADQVTLRKLYAPKISCLEGTWISEHTNKEKDDLYFDYIKYFGTKLETLPYGMAKYSIYGIGTVADDDCMSKGNTNEIRYLILRPDCHLYTRWDDKASIIF